MTDTLKKLSNIWKRLKLNFVFSLKNQKTQQGHHILKTDICQGNNKCMSLYLLKISGGV